MEKDSALFEASGFELCDSLEIQKTPSLTELTRMIGERIKAAERGREQQEKLDRELVRKREEERELLVAKELLDVQIGKMTAFFGCDRRYRWRFRRRGNRRATTHHFAGDRGASRTLPRASRGHYRR